MLTIWKPLPFLPYMTKRRGGRAVSLYPNLPLELQVKLYTAQHRLRRVSLGPHFGRQNRRAIREENYSVRAAATTLSRDRA